MSVINDGGPAFGGSRRIRRAGYDTNEFEPVNGMSLRDYFAAKALEAQIVKLAGNSLWDEGGCTYDKLALESYLVADAMLKARTA